MESNDRNVVWDDLSMQPGDPKWRRRDPALDGDDPDYD
jgi:hypothetical protein